MAAHQRTQTAPARTAAANQARRRKTEDKLRTVADILQRMSNDKIPVTYPAVARRAGVSRTFLYDNPTARKLVSAAVEGGRHQRQREQINRDGHAQASLRERALNAEDALKAAYAEIRVQRGRIAALLGQLRDAEHDLTQDSVQRITSENLTLKQRVRQLAADNRSLQERLQGARSNNRFLDKRIADLEAQLMNPAAT